MAEPIDIYLEVGAKRTFAGAIAWPGWCRSGKNEGAALEALAMYAPRYAEVVRPSVKPASALPEADAELRMVERLKGDATTDFGAPSIAPAADREEITEKAFVRLRLILSAAWAAFDQAVASADGIELAKGPRGGGRDLSAIVAHVVNAEAGYTGRLGVKRPDAGEQDAAAIETYRAAVLLALDDGFRHGLPSAGPRGGKIWTIPYFVRRAAWHVLDHTWEIEDRAVRP